MNRMKPSFLEPQVKQYGSHMVMTNVAKHPKYKFINIDSKYREGGEPRYLNTYEQYKSNFPSNFQISLPERVNDVKSLMVCNAEIPMSFHNISASLGNNSFKIIIGGMNGTQSETVRIPNGEYTITTLQTAIQAAIHSISAFAGTPDKIVFTIHSTSHTSTFTSNNGSFAIVFDVDSDGNTDAYHFKNKLGWLLGFRKRNYTIASSTSTTALSENIVDLNTVRYMYLVVEEYTKCGPNSFISPIHNSFLQKNILAKISMNKKTFAFGDILPANSFNGYLLSDRRQYPGKIDLQKLNVQLVDDTGTPIDLNGMDFSFCLEIEYE